MVNLEQGRLIVDAALDYAATNKFAPTTAVVLGADASVRNVAAQTLACPALFPVARAKAAGALGFRMSSREIGELFAGRPHIFASVPGLIDGGMVPAAGAVLFGTAEGTLLGAIGVSGDTSEKDEAAALAGVKAAGLHIWKS